MFARPTMKLELSIDSRPLHVELDDVIAGLLAARLGLPPDGDHRGAIGRYLGDAAGPWTLDDDHMRKRVMRRLILDIADPTLVIQYLMADQADQAGPGEAGA
ncbi:hypothetical protein DF142_35390 [Burkholderia cenocepacia]|nr:hypothetical protein DF142_35390 [Burkholderia cenocepacia]RQU55079.1 hypothetical protein DF140_35165 [Burkholderia cenocepacia]